MSTVGALLLLLAGLQLAVKSLFRYRTWKDRGLTVLVLQAALLIVLLAWGEAVYRMAAHLYSIIPGSGLIVPAFFCLLGLLGWDAFLIAFFFLVLQPDLRLFAAAAAPMILGNIPKTLFLLFTLPPQEPRGAPPKIP